MHGTETVGDEEGLRKASATLKQRQQALRQYCEDNGLSYKPDRTAVVGYNRTVAGKVNAVNRGKTLDISGKTSLEKSNTHQPISRNTHTVGKIDINKYRCVTEDIATDEVIITEKQIEHIKMRHPNDYERFSQYFKEIVEAPDYIIEANKPNTALVLKTIHNEQEQFKTVIRLVTSTDNPDYKNSIITFMKINEKEWNRLIKNKKVLYKSE